MLTLKPEKITRQPSFNTRDVVRVEGEGAKAFYALVDLATAALDFIETEDQRGAKNGSWNIKQQVNELLSQVDEGRDTALFPREKYDLRSMRR